MQLLKTLAAQLPPRVQAELKRLHFARQIKAHTFETPEHEFKMLHELVRDGEWVIDVGANVGHYTKRLSELVGRNGRVIAFEPVPATFALLASNVELLENQNVTLINAAVSDQMRVVGMTMPRFESGLENYYEAHLTDATGTEFSVLTIPIDSMAIVHKISLVKIDAEGHESSVLGGMQRLIAMHKPTLIVETGSNTIIDQLSSLGYAAHRAPDSANVVFRPL